MVEVETEAMVEAVVEAMVEVVVEAMVEVEAEAMVEVETVAMVEVVEMEVMMMIEVVVMMTVMMRMMTTRMGILTVIHTHSPSGNGLLIAGYNSLAMLHICVSLNDIVQFQQWWGDSLPIVFFCQEKLS